MPKDIFDLTDVSDLPEDLRHVQKAAGKATRIRDLMLRAPQPFTSGQLRAACYRETGEVLDASSVSWTLSRAVTNGLLERVSHGLYRVKEPSK